MTPARRPVRILLAAALAVSFAPAISACSETRTSESTGQYVDSAAITTKVKAALVQDQSLKAFDIHVETFKDEVQLSGFVDTPALKARAAEVAGRVEGVHSVKNNLIVKGAG
ncbi:MAG TPA: BON domain-containing protein [Stellaceae bacterium]|nr:BON domain-containing protein [Stellaceae bacterium]